MDLSVKLVLRAQAEGTSAIRAMKEETAELATALKEVREAARSGGQVSPSSIKALGGYAEFQKAIADEQKRLAVGEKEAGPVDEESLFRGRIRMTNSQAKVRLAESERVARAEIAEAKSVVDAQRREVEGVVNLRKRLWTQQQREVEGAHAAERREAEETLRTRMRLWAQQGREAEAEARAEAQAVERSQADQRRAAEETLAANMRYWAARGRAARETEAQETRAAVQAARAHREALRGMGLGMFAGRDPEGEHRGREGHGRGRGVLGELATAAEYTLTYGAINKVMEGVGAVLGSPIALGKMTLGVAEQARQVKELGLATRLTTNQVQELQYAFAAKGLDADKLPQTLLWLNRSEVGAARGIKTNAIAFKALGISVFDANHHLKATQDLLYETADALYKRRGSPVANSISQMIFGRGVKDILPIIQGGAGQLKALASEADKSGFVIRPEDLERGEQLAGQWSRLKLQLDGIRNTAAVAAMPVVSDLIGDASNYMTQNRAQITKDIRDNFNQLRTDLPSIVSGLKAMADSVLAMSRNIGPVVSDLIAVGNMPITKYIFSGEVVPGGFDLGKPEGSQGDKPTQLYDPETHRPLAVAQPEVHVHVHPAPGVAVGAVTSRGAKVTANRGAVQSGG